MAFRKLISLHHQVIKEEGSHSAGLLSCYLMTEADPISQTSPFGKLMTDIQSNYLCVSTYNKI
jgi:hypothetical protein